METGRYQPDSGLFLETWPVSGSMRNGSVFARPTWEPHTGAFDGSVWPTANAHDSTGAWGKNFMFADGHYKPHDLVMATEQWPTARAEDAESAGNHPNAVDSLTGATRQWLTPTVSDNRLDEHGAARYGSEVMRQSDQRLRNQAATWLTPHGMNGTEADGRQGRGGEFAKQATSWPTPTADDSRSAGGMQSREEGKEATLTASAKLWRTPDTPGTGGPRNRQVSIGQGHQVTIAEQAEHWGTPTSRDWKDGASPDNRPGRGDNGLVALQVLNWPTPNVPNGGRTSNVTDQREDGSKRQIDLGALAKNWENSSESPATADAPSLDSSPMFVQSAELSAPDTQTSADRKTSEEPSSDLQRIWATPTPWQQEEDRESWEARREREKAKGRNGNGMGEPLDMQAQTFPSSPQDPVQPASGRTCWCGTLNCGLPSHKRRLNPYFAEWLMGVPINLTSKTARIGSERLEIWFARSRRQLQLLNWREGQERETMPVLKLIGLVNGEETEYDGQYVVEYDPRPRMADDGEFVHLVVTADPAKALQFASVEDAFKLWKAEYGLRPDGEPNRPLTAFSVEVGP